MNEQEKKKGVGGGGKGERIRGELWEGGNAGRRAKGSKKQESYRRRRVNGPGKPYGWKRKERQHGEKGNGRRSNDDKECDSLVVRQGIRHRSHGV